MTYFYLFIFDQMLCNDHTRFMEIADVFYNLQLTVLKGVMESRLDNTWACFIVEVIHYSPDMHHLYTYDDYVCMHSITLKIFILF